MQNLVYNTKIIIFVIRISFNMIRNKNNKKKIGIMIFFYYFI